MVDQVELATPAEQVRVARRAVDIRDEGIEPDDSGSQVGIDRAIRNGIEGERAREIGEAEILADASPQDVLDLRVGLTLAESRVEVHQCRRRHRQPEHTGYFRGEQLGDQRLHSLPRATKLHHVCPRLVGLDDSGQRPPSRSGRR